MENKTTIDDFLERMSGKGIDGFDSHQGIKLIKAACSKIPVNGEYDPSIIGNRIGEYVHAIMECGKFISSIGVVEKRQQIVVEAQQAEAALTRAPLKGFTTSIDKKMYSQMDKEYILEKEKLINIQGVMSYVENCRTSLDKAHLHCKKILEHSRVENRMASDHEKHSFSGIEWMAETEIK